MDCLLILLEKYLNKKCKGQNWTIVRPVISFSSKRLDLLLYSGKDVLNYADMPPKEVGFQYPSFFIENGYAYILSRTGFNKADDFHNTNAITFHKVKL